MANYISINGNGFKKKSDDLKFYKSLHKNDGFYSDVKFYKSKKV